MSYCTISPGHPHHGPYHDREYGFPISDDAALFERLVNNPPQHIDTMLMEGSSLGRLDEKAQFPTEAEIEARLAENFKLPGFVMISASAQNIDRMVSIYRACKRTAVRGGVRRVCRRHTWLLP